MKKEIVGRRPDIGRVVYGDRLSLMLGLEEETARQLVLDYLVGKHNPWNRREATVQEPIIRDLLLQAGYTELALGCYPDMYYGDISGGKKIHAMVHAENIYGIKPATYDGVALAKRVVRNYPPDYPPGKDSMRDTLLEELRQFTKVRNDLWARGKRWLSLEEWSFEHDGSVRYLLNPISSEADSGWYGLDDLRSWLDGDPNSPVLKSNQPTPSIPFVVPKFDPMQKWRQEFVDIRNLIEVSGDKITSLRLLRIQLMRCPIASLAREFSPLLDQAVPSSQELR